MRLKESKSLNEPELPAAQRRALRHSVGALCSSILTQRARSPQDAARRGDSASTRETTCAGTRTPARTQSALPVRTRVLTFCPRLVSKGGLHAGCVSTVGKRVRLDSGPHGQTHRLGAGRGRWAFCTALQAPTRASV